MAQKMPVNRYFDQESASVLYDDPTHALARLLTEIWFADGQVRTSINLLRSEQHGDRPGLRGIVVHELERLSALVEAWLLTSGRWTSGGSITPLALQMAAHEVLAIDLKAYRGELDKYGAPKTSL